MGWEEERRKRTGCNRIKVMCISRKLEYKISKFRQDTVTEREKENKTERDRKSKRFATLTGHALNLTSNYSKVRFGLASE